MEDDSQVRFQPRVRLRILSYTLEALLVQALPGRAPRSFHGQKAVLGPEHTGLQAFWPTPCRFHAPALQTASRLNMYLSFYQHSVSAVGCMRQVIVKRLRRDNHVRDVNAFHVNRALELCPRNEWKFKIKDYKKSFLESPYLSSTNLKKIGLHVERILTPPTNILKEAHSFVFSIKKMPNRCSKQLVAVSFQIPIFLQNLSFPESWDHQNS